MALPCSSAAQLSYNDSHNDKLGNCATHTGGSYAKTRDQSGLIGLLLDSINTSTTEPYLTKPGPGRPPVVKLNIRCSVRGFG